MFQRPESWITNDVPLSTPGLDDTRLFMSLTAGAGTRTLLLSSLPSLTFMKEKESLNKVSFFYSLIFLSSCGCFIRKPIIVPVTGPLLWNSYYLPVDSFGKKERRKVDRVFANHYLSQPPVSRNFQHSLSLLSVLHIGCKS